MTVINKKPEILAPGGSAAAVYAAMNAGCDAVYMGGKRFGARAFADNPETDELLCIMDDVHMRGKKLYLTVNTVLTQKEFVSLYDYIKEVYEHGVDAVIVQDMGVLKFIHEEFPDLQIHASTQMSVLKADAVNFMKKYGVTRVVPARELTLGEIKAINDNTDAEIEVFVHGALCCSMSGQCLMSSLIGGRSGNRGACAQPCRKEYIFNGGKKEYYLSLKDLCAIDYIPELVMNGVDSFKIEGRMKKPEYVALASHIYRKYTDIFFEKGYDEYKNEVIYSKEYEKDYTALLDIYNRGGFTTGYLVDKKVTEDIFAKDKSSHAGVMVGRMKGKKIIAVEKEMYAHDVLEIRDNSGNAVHEHTLKDGLKTGEISINPGYNADKIRSGYEVYRIRNNTLIEYLNNEFGTQMTDVHIQGSFFAKKNERIKLVVTCNDVSVETEGSVCEKASKIAATPEDVISKVKVSGDSYFVWDKLEVMMDDDVFLAAKELKSIRREAFEKLKNAIAGKYRRTAPCKKNDFTANSIYKDTHTSEDIIAECRNVQQLQVIVADNNVSVVYLHAEDLDKAEIEKCSEIIEKTDKYFYIVLPRVTREDVLTKFLTRYDWEELRCKCDNFKGFVITSLEQLAACDNNINDNYIDRELFEIRTADNMYVRNMYAYDFFKENNVSHVSLSVEMTEREYETFEGADADVLVYGKVPVMIMLNHHGANGKLQDSYGNAYQVIEHAKTGYTEIINYEPVNMLDGIGRFKGMDKRVSFTTESSGQIRKILGMI